MLELNKFRKKIVDSFRSQVVKVQKAEVEARKKEIPIECKDLDEVTSWEDVCVVLREQFNLNGIEESAIKRMKKAYVGTQIAIISFPVE